MGIFDKIFKGTRKESKNIVSQINVFQIPVISDFSFMPISDDELNSLKEYSTSILGSMLLSGLEQNEKHEFHP